MIPTVDGKVFLRRCNSRSSGERGSHQGSNLGSLTETHILKQFKKPLITHFQTIKIKIPIKFMPLKSKSLTPNS